MPQNRNMRAAQQNLQLNKRNNKAAAEELKNDKRKRQRVGLVDLSNAISTSLRISESKKKSSSDEVTNAKGKATKTRICTRSKTLSGNKEDVVEKKQVSFIDPCPEYDFDALCHDSFMVPRYAMSIFKYYKQREMDFLVSDYLRFHPVLLKVKRALVINWLVQNQQDYELNHEVLYHAVKLFDLFMSRVKNMSEFELIAGTCLMIASKIDVQDPPAVEDLLLLPYSKESIDLYNKFELKVMEELDYDINCPLSYIFLRRFSRAAFLDLATLTLARYVLETSLLFYEFVSVPDSAMAAASLLLAIKSIGKESWDARLVKYSNYTEREIEPLMWRLNHMMKLCPLVFKKCEQTREKYTHELFFNASSAPLLPDQRPKDEPVGPPSEYSFAFFSKLRR